MPIQRASGVSFEPSGNRVVILDTAGTIMTTLNPVGSIIWKALDGVRDLAALANDLLPEFQGVDLDTLTKDISDFIDVLRKSGLIEETG